MLTVERVLELIDEVKEQGGKPKKIVMNIDTKVMSPFKEWDIFMGLPIEINNDCPMGIAYIYHRVGVFYLWLRQ